MSWICERCGVSCGPHRRKRTTWNCRTPRPGTQSSVRTSRGARRSSTKWNKDLYPTWSDLQVLQARVDKFLASPAPKSPPSSQASRTEPRHSPVSPVQLEPSAHDLLARVARLRALLAAKKDEKINVRSQQQLEHAESTLFGCNAAQQRRSTSGSKKARTRPQSNFQPQSSATRSCRGKAGPACASRGAL